MRIKKKKKKTNWRQYEEISEGKKWFPTLNQTHDNHYDSITFKHKYKTMMTNEETTSEN